MHPELEKTLATHCAPVLLGIKPSALFTVPSSFLVDLPLISSRLDEDLASEVLCSHTNSELVLVYRRSLLKQTLNDPSIKNFLASQGYPLNKGLEGVISHLRRRLCQFCPSKDFPHEVGMLLGYPPEDVIGFIRNRGQECKYVGPWKVYGDVEQAKALFSKYEDCKNYLQSHIANGGSLYNLCLNMAVAV